MFRYEKDETGRVQRVYAGETWICDTSGEEYAKQITSSLNNWNEVKRLFLATTNDTEQFIDAISRMIQEETQV